MSRFYERYGLTILWVLTLILGTFLACWALVVLADNNVLPGWIAGPVVGIQREVAEVLDALGDRLQRNSSYAGAIATLGTFLFGLWQGVIYARKSLPNRLIDFMEEELAPVHDNAEALVTAVTVRSANVPHRAPLFLQGPLYRALDALGNRGRPRKRASLDEAVEEAEEHIRVTKERLLQLESLRSHALLLRGAVQSYSCIMSDCDRKQKSESDSCSEQDFTSAIENPATKAAALELRGLLRSRTGSLAAALADFETLAEASEGRDKARALRLQSEIKIRQFNGASLVRLDEARSLLNEGRRDLETDRTLVGEDYLELGQNRIAYGQMKEKAHSITGNDAHLARQAYDEACKYLEQARMSEAKPLFETAQRSRDRLQ